MVERFSYLIITKLLKNRSSTIYPPSVPLINLNPFGSRTCNNANPFYAQSSSSVSLFRCRARDGYQPKQAIDLRKGELGERL